MEYGVFVDDARMPPADPREICSAEWQAILPPGQLRAIYFGTEFCPELIPDFDTVEKFCSQAKYAEIEAVLLTPIVTPKGLEQIDRLLERIVARGLTPAILINDWGVLDLLRKSYPRLPRRGGRLMNRGLRDPRLLGKLPGVNSSPADRGGRLLPMLARLGVEAVETDPDLQGSFLGEKREGLQRVVHLPYVFAASSRNCLIKANGALNLEGCFTKGLGVPCDRACGGRWHQVKRADSSRCLWRAGNTIFYEATRSQAEVHLAQADRIVLYARPTN